MFQTKPYIFLNEEKWRFDIRGMYTKIYHVFFHLFDCCVNISKCKILEYTVLHGEKFPFSRILGDLGMGNLYGECGFFKWGKWENRFKKVLFMYLKLYLIELKIDNEEFNTK